MMDEAPVRYRLKDLAVVYDGDAQSRPIGEIFNPFALSAWFGKEGMAVIFTSKRLLITGPLVIRALKLSGFRDPEERRRLFVSDDDDATSAYQYGSGGYGSGGASGYQGQYSTSEDGAAGPSMWQAMRHCLGLFFLGKPLRRVGAWIRLVEGGDRFHLEHKL